MTTTDALFRALSDPTRRAILERLMREGEVTVHRLTAGAGVSQPMVSKHLSILAGADLVRDRKSGRETFYSAKPEGLAPLTDWMAEYRGFWASHLDKLDDLLKRMDQ